MQPWSFRGRSLSWETFDWSEMKIRALPGVSSHPLQRGLGLDYKSSGPNGIFHDFSCGPYLQLRIAVKPGHRPNTVHHDNNNHKICSGEAVQL